MVWENGLLRALKPFFSVVAIFILLIAGRQAIVLIFQPPPFLFPGIDRIARALVARPEFWRANTQTTVLETLIGLVVGASAGAGLALGMVVLPRLGRVLLPLLVLSQAFPVFALAPLLVLWFGFGVGSKMVMATIAIFFPVASAFRDGLLRADPGLLDLFRLHDGSAGQELLLLRIPAALPALISGLRLAAVYAPIGALIGEWVGASSGLGYVMLQANGRSETDVVFAALLIIGALSVLLRAAVNRLTRNLTPWAPEASL